ncbi:MAG: hypothetical protein MUC65_05395 [Pontiellaceae bacterium]|nr:hypothetical protein [Pontiellaceae bacterium]
MKRPDGLVENVKTVETLRSLKRPGGLVKTVKTVETLRSLKRPDGLVEGGSGRGAQWEKT